MDNISNQMQKANEDTAILQELLDEEHTPVQLERIAIQTEEETTGVLKE